jgi:MYXO-CTERM domain-containing protein
MKPSLSVLVLSLVLGVGAGVARADLAPPDSCSSPGQPCQNAGAAYNQSGTCTAATCQRSVPNADGGLTSMSYACDVCQAMGTGGGSGTGTGGSTGAAGAPAHTGGGSSGCAVAPGRPDGSGPGGVAVLVAIGLAAAFRRRHAST